MSNAQILVVDDEPIVAKSIQMELSGMGYAVPVIAASGEDALEKAGQTHPDLVLMDISLRGPMDGVETSKRMQERFDIPIVYGNGRRAILAIEKGTPGERAFADAFAAWGQ